MLRMIRKLVSWLIYSLGALCLIAVCFISFSPEFGGSPDAQSQAKITASKHFDGDSFFNLIPTQVSTRSEHSPSILSTLMGLLFASENKNPTDPIISSRFVPDTFNNGEMVWFGHSTVLFKTQDITIATDPIFGRASPLPLGGKPFAMTNPTQPDDFPALDVVLISHDHYDHLSQQAIKSLSAKVRWFFVPLGVKAHLQRWGIDDNYIREFDWYETVNVGDVTFTFTPSRHFSGRGVTNQNSTLWGSWVVKSVVMSVFFSGDGGYSPEFSKIGAQYGPFDVVLMENGAYNQDWAQIHMFPEQTAKAAAELQAKQLLPIHWGKYDLARHRWREPVERIVA